MALVASCSICQSSNGGFAAFGNTPGSANCAIEKDCWALIGELLYVKEMDRFDWDAFNLEMDEDVEKTVEEVYPDLLDKRYPPSWPLDNCMRYYWTAGYRGF